MRQAIDDLLAPAIEGSAPWEQWHSDLIMLVTREGHPGLRLGQDEDGTLLAIYEIGGMAVFNMPLSELLERPIRAPKEEEQKTPAGVQ
jgi:hypothetical protein